MLLAGDKHLTEPETRASLIARLNLPSSEAAWDEFTAIYRPLILRVAIARGLQHADAEDLAQDTLAIVGRSIGAFDPNGGGSFRAWLRTITRNLVINHLSRRREPLGSGSSGVQAMLSEHPAPDSETATLFDLEYRRLLFQRAAEVVRPQFSQTTWAAFKRTAIDRWSVGETAQHLGKSEGAIRMARSRVVTRLREEVQRQQQRLS